MPEAVWDLTSVRLAWEAITGRGIHALAGDAYPLLRVVPQLGWFFNVVGWLALAAAAWLGWVLATTVGDVRVVNLYVPNGSEVGSEKYTYKLGWLRALRDYLAEELQQHENLVVLGDFNIAPADEDVYDPEKWGDAILCSPAERAALGELFDLGLTDVFRKFDQPEKSFSWWDYRAAMFRRNAGLRIDLILTSAAMTKRCAASYIDREPRTWERPSDHTPVIAEFAD
jgi:exodeoxyribonuclease-3